MENNKWDLLTTGVFADDEVSELVANNYNAVFVKRKGVKIRLDNLFDSEEDYINSIQDLAELIEKEQDDFLFEGRLKNEKVGIVRVHVVMPPATDVPQVTMARKSLSMSTLDNYLKYNSINSRIADFLRAATKIGITMVFSGGTGTGKTTLLEALTKEWDDDWRIGVVEDSPELMLKQPNVTYLHSSVWKPGMDLNEVATLQWCVQQINRMRTDRLIIGETRGKEFFDFVQAANSGQNGSLTTIHADSPKMALQKMSQFVVMAMPQPTRVANLNIASTIGLIIQLKRYGPLYRVDEIAEVSRILSNDESASIATSTLFKYNPKTDSWEDTSLSGLTDESKKLFEKHGYSLNNFKKSNYRDNSFEEFSANFQGFNRGNI